MASKRNSKSGCIGWAVVTFLGFGLINSMCSKHEPTKTPPAPVAYVPTAQERAAAAKQSESDAKFWAAKNAKEQAEVNAYNKENETLRDARADAAQYVQSTQPVYVQRAAPVQRRGLRGYRRITNGQDESPVSRRVRGDDGARKTQHVSGYTRKDGTHVSSYSRRAPKK